MTMSNRNRKYSNGTITVVWQPAECIHAGVCFTSLRKVFDPVKRPWVNMEGAATEQIIDVVERCPTQALTFFWNDPSAVTPGKENSPKLFDTKNLTRLFPAPTDEEAAAKAAEKEGVAPAAKITFRRGGPLVIEGCFDMIDENGAPIQSKLKMVSLCRCGLSDSQPFCDGAHFKAGFRK